MLVICHIKWTKGLSVSVISYLTEVLSCIQIDDKWEVKGSFKRWWNQDIWREYFSEFINIPGVEKVQSVSSYYDVIWSFLIFRKTCPTSLCGKRNSRNFSSRRTWTNTFWIWGTTWSRSWWPEFELTSSVDIWSMSQSNLFCEYNNYMMCLESFEIFDENKK